MQANTISQISYLHFLLSEFQSRKSRNASYSLRAFARDLNIAAPKLSEIFRGKCGLSESSARQIANRLNMKPEETELFVNLVNAKHARSKILKQQAIHNLSFNETFASYNELTLDTFRIISDWCHFAILELTEVADFKFDSAWIARRLDLPVEQIDEAIERLLDFGLLERRDGTAIQTHNSLTTPHGVPSGEIRKYHRQILAKAEAALTNEDYAVRDFSAITLAIPVEAYSEIQAEIKKFRRMISEKYVNSNNKARVYSLAIQLFPLDKKGDEL